MAATYTNISIDEMRGFLASSNGWREESVGRDKEVIFQYPLRNRPNILIKVYTGIKKDSGQSRKVGRDAIRVCAVNTATDRGWIKSKRVHRVAGWKTNLKNRVVQVIREANARV